MPIRRRRPGPPFEHGEHDLEDPAVPAAVVDDVVGRHGALDILVAVHARSSTQRLADVTATELDRCWAANVRSVVLLAQRFAELHDPARPGGRMVWFTSGQHLAPMGGEIAYAATKGALHQLTRSLADVLVDQRNRGQLHQSRAGRHRVGGRRHPAAVAPCSRRGDGPRRRRSGCGRAAGPRRGCADRRAGGRRGGGVPPLGRGPRVKVTAPTEPPEPKGPAGLSARRCEVDGIADGDRSRREDAEDRTGPAHQGRLGAGADDVVQELAGRGAPDDLELDVPDAGPAPGASGTSPSEMVTFRRVPAGSMGLPSWAAASSRAAWDWTVTCRWRVPW